MAKMQHSGGLVETYLEMGFDMVKYFEITANGTSQQLVLTSPTPPARKLTLKNASTTEDLYFNIVDDTASTTVSSTPGNNIKVGPGCVFSMDFDILTKVSFITEGASVLVEGILGWKGTKSC
jgi:hypothetical protein